MQAQRAKAKRTDQVNFTLLSQKDPQTCHLPLGDYAVSPHLTASP